MIKTVAIKSHKGDMRQPFQFAKTDLIIPLLYVQIYKTHYNT